MRGLTIELLPQRAQDACNEARWQELLADPDLARFDGRVETDRHGQVIMTPPPAPKHGSYQSKIAHMLHVCASQGRVLTECPVSTADGVKATDVAWASPETMRALGERGSFPRAPEICVEVKSPRNSEAELREKAALYFDAGALEVWVCSESGVMTFWHAGEVAPLTASRIFPDFPSPVVLS